MDEKAVKYEILLNAVLQVARISSLTSDHHLYTVNDEFIYAVVKALEPEKYEQRVKQLEL